MEPITRALFLKELSIPAPTDTHTIFAQHHVFDARGIAKHFRHVAIFDAPDILGPSEVIRFINDHDPLPLLAQIDRHYGPCMDAGYVARESDSTAVGFTVRAAG